jgi:hypothetical protein
VIVFSVVYGVVSVGRFADDPSVLGAYIVIACVMLVAIAVWGLRA